jgi:CRISPR-associated exonuclease Cas4
MKISEIEISNWRSIKDVNITFQDLMILIGQNNHGKSNVLNAILFFFSEIKPQDLDFNGESDELYVEVTFDGLVESERSTFAKYVTADHKIKVRRTASKGGSLTYQGYTQSPVFEWLKEENASSYTTRSVAESLEFYSLLPESGRITKAMIQDAQTQYIEGNIAELEFNYDLEATNFMGAKNVAKGIFGDIFYIPAVKVTSDDYSNNSSSIFSKLYGRIISDISANNTGWVEAKETVASLFRLLNKADAEGNQNTQRPAQLGEFETKLNEQLASWGSEVELEVLPPNVDDVFKANTQVWVNDGCKTDISRKGNGLQRALSFALIKTLADILNTEQTTDNSNGRSASQSMFFILEEPELYLHPQAQRALLDTLSLLSESVGAQVVLCTHSASLIDLSKYKSICIIRKESVEIGTKACQCEEELFIGNGKKDFNLSYWINPDRSELFFAKKVILAEGATEKTVMPFLAQRLGCFKHDYSVIDCGSKNNIPMYCNLLNKFKIPYIAVYDIDHQSHKNAEALASSDTATQAVEDAINTEYGSSIIFVNDIEEELGMPRGYGGKPYSALEYISPETYTLPAQIRDKIISIYE